MRDNNGFEDREGHQAPFTLPIAESGPRLAERSTIAALLELFDLLNDCVEVGPVAAFELGMDELVIGANLERAAARWNEGERRDAIAEFKNFGRQTDGLRRVVSNDAIFDGDFRLQREPSFRKQAYETRARRSIVDLADVDLRTRN